MKENLPLFSVSEISNFIKDSLECALPNIRIIGEVSNFSHHAPSGHLYFSLKDRDALIKAVCFKNFAQKVNFEIENGAKITVTGKISAFVKSSNYQIIISDIEKSGAGELAKIFEELKQKLQKEGLFNQEYKKQLPFLPKSIGLITAGGGAVLHDILTTLEDRFPTRVVLYKSIMQGVNAAKSVISGIKYFNNKKNVDVIIVARGGGSFEDLFEFNNENLIREAFKSKIPIISAIGHETDFTLLDFVADKRAPTPTGSIIHAVPSKKELEWKLNNLHSSILQFFNKEISGRVYKLQNSNIRLKNVKFILDAKINNLMQQLSKVKASTLNNLDKIAKHLEQVFYEISLFDIKNILNQGFGVVTKDGKKINSIKELQNGDLIKIIMQDGELDAVIKQNKIDSNIQNTLL